MESGLAYLANKLSLHMIHLNKFTILRDIEQTWFDDKIVVAKLAFLGTAMFEPLLQTVEDKMHRLRI